MTPEERNLIIELFDRLATLEDAQRDPEAERLIRDGLRQAPNAPYALVQTVLVQDEALKRADARIRALEGGAEPPRETSFLGGMRDSLLGRRESRGSVPSVRPGEAGMSPAWQTGTQAQTGTPMAPGGYGSGPAPAPAPMAQGGSFLGTAAAAAAGVIGGSLLLGGIRNMMGGHQQGGAHAAYDPAAGGTAPSPWSGDSAGGDLSRQAGLDDIGQGSGGGGGGGSRGFGLFDQSPSDASGEDPAAGDFDESGFDDSGLDDDGGGGSDE
jgi:uncharacterized protein